jgi:hypothetical protein
VVVGSADAVATEAERASSDVPASRNVRMRVISASRIGSDSHRSVPAVADAHKYVKPALRRTLADT